MPKWFLLFYAFIIGFLLDLFSGNLGMHSTACLILVLIKSPISKITIPHNIIEENDFDTIGGIVVEKFGRFPDCDESIEIDNYSYKIANGNSRQISLLEVTRNHKTE